jgi:hypothetical protein
MTDHRPVICFQARSLPDLGGLDRGFYKAVGIVSRSFYALAQLLPTLMALPWNYPKAAEHLLQACRNCGIA